MSPVIYEPPENHDCQPLMYRSNYDGSMVPAYRTNTIWACDDCGQRWIVEEWDHGLAYHGGPRRITRNWARHDKDTP